MAKAILQQILAAPRRGQAFLADRPRVAAGLLALLFLSLAVAGSGVVKPREIDFLNPLSAFSSSDFDDYFQASKTFSKGEDPYRVGQINDLFSMMRSPLDLGDPLKLAAAIENLKGVGTYLYPPFTACLLTPLTTLKYEFAAGIFQTLSLLALAGYLLYLFRLHRQAREDDAPFWLAALAATALLYRFLDGNAGNGNIGFFLILFCGGGLLLIFRGPAILEFAGGLLLGLATVMKITPGFFGLVLIGGRRIVAIFGMGAGAAFALVAPAGVLGWRQNLDLFGNWYQLIVQTFSEVSFIRPWMNNQSVSGAIGKLFIPGSDMKQAEYGLPLGNISDQGGTALFAQGVQAANLALVVLGLLTAGFVALRYRKPAGR
ncbi:MAG: glycosyltransferase family 87 protein, partial [Leptospirales bacterium]